MPMAEPSPIRQALMELAQRLGIDRPAAAARVFSSWEQIVGEEVAGRCSPLSLKDGVLRVATSSPAWAAELRYLGPEMARRVNEEVGAEVVKRVEAKVRTPDQEALEKGERKRAKRRFYQAK